MIKQRNDLRKRVLVVGLLFLLTISTMLSVDILQTLVNASAANITAEKNSTFSKPLQSNTTGDDEVGMTFVIPNTPPTKNNSTMSTPTTASSTSLSKNESGVQENNETNKTTSSSSSQTAGSTSNPVDQATNNSSAKSPDVNKMQRGEYKVDENGVHYYNINNCSEVRGSSGIGDLSECQDAEKQMRDDM